MTITKAGTSKYIIKMFYYFKNYPIVGLYSQGHTHMITDILITGLVGPEKLK
jgi:hypothetical protein